MKDKDTDVADEFNKIIIDDNEYRDTKLAQRPAKQKQTSSLASPPKVSYDDFCDFLYIDELQKEGGRGPSKCPKQTPDSVPSQSCVSDTIDKNPHRMEEEVAHESTSAITSSITSSDTPSHDRTSTPADLNEDAVMKTQLDEDNSTCPAQSNDEMLLLQVSNVLMDTKISTTCVPTDTQTSQADGALVDVAKTVSWCLTPTQLILQSQPAMDDNNNVSPSNLSEMPVNN